VTPAYFETLRIPMIRGRVFTDADGGAAARVMVVNQAFVRKYSADLDPIGRQVASSGGPRTVIGIVGDIQQKAGWGNFGPLAPVPASYVPVAQTNDALLKMVHTWFSPSIFIRTVSSPQGIAAEMQRAVQSVDPLLPFAKFRTLDDVRAEAVATQRAQATLLGALAALALLLAAVGLYGLVANSVMERTRELGIRIALGASISRAVVVAAAPGSLLAAVGIAIGLIVARLGATVMRGLVWGISPSDPLTFTLAAVVVFATAVVATLIPALRIVRLNPITALRSS
jgi:putative ABC transport system permease protein